MQSQSLQSAEEIRRLQRCINDLVSVLALPAIWTGGEPTQILNTLLSSLLGMLELDFIYVSLRDNGRGEPCELLLAAPSLDPDRPHARDVRETVDHLADFQNASTYRVACAGRDVCLLPMRLGLQGEIGLLAAASQRHDFPQQTERLVLSVAANQASIALQEARLFSKQIRVNDDLDSRVALRTAELAQTNEVLKKEIAERKKVEAQLRQSEAEIKRSEAKLLQVIDTIPTLAWCNLPDGPNEFLNKGWHEYTGLSPEKSHGWGWQTAFHADDLPALMKKWQELLISGQPGEIEARLRRHDGVYRWFLIRVEPFHDDTGKIIRWYGTSTDIEDRKRAEQALRTSEREFSLIINTIPALAWSARPDGFAEFFNEHYLEYVGLPLEMLQGIGWTSVVHPDDLFALTERWQSIMAAGEPGEAEARLRRHDGQYRWFLFRSHPMRNESGIILKWYGTNTDIDDRKRAEAELWRSKAFLAEGQHLASIGNFSWLLGTDEIKWSEQLYRIFEFQLGTPVTLERIASMVHPDDTPTFFEMTERVRAEVSNFEYEHRLLMPDGRVKYLHLVAHVNRNSQGRLEYIGAVQDVTRRKSAENALAKARSELAQVMRINSLAMLTAAIAHEVNQPLSGIVTNAGTCLRMLGSDPPNVDGARETARRTIRDGNRAAEVVARLRALFSKKEVKFVSVDLNDGTREVIALLLNDLQRNHILLETNLADNLPRINGDRIQLQQVILNLLRNASEAMSDVNDRPRRLSIRTHCVDDTQVILTVQDVGVGIDAHAADRLFEAFFTTKTDGMGIGLSISRSIIEAHHGHLWATPNEGPGATFSFSIPRATP